MGPGHMSWSGSWMFGGFGWLIGLLLLIGVVALVVWVVQRSTGGISSGGHQNFSTDDKMSAQDILDARYARGEINRDEYQSMRKDIISDGGSA